MMMTFTSQVVKTWYLSMRDDHVDDVSLHTYIHTCTYIYNNYVDMAILPNNITIDVGF